MNGAVAEEEHAEQHGREGRDQHLELQPEQRGVVLQPAVQIQRQVQQPGQAEGQAEEDADLFPIRFFKGGCGVGNSCGLNILVHAISLCEDGCVNSGTHYSVDANPVAQIPPVGRYPR